MTTSGLRCTYRPYIKPHVRGRLCGRPEADPVHPQPDERMPHGGHVYRHETVRRTSLGKRGRRAKEKG